MIKKMLYMVIVLLVALSGCACNSGRSEEISEFEILDEINNEFEFIPPENIEKYGHKEIVDDFNSEISVGYKNEDGTYSLYIFSSPVKYKEGFNEYIDIDNRLKRIYAGKYFEDGYSYINNKGYVYSLFPEELDSENMFMIENGLYDIEFGLIDCELVGTIEKDKENCWGQKVDMMVYTSNNCQVNAYATKAGMKTEIILHSLPLDNKIEFLVKSTDLRKQIENNYLIFTDESKSKENQIQAIIRTPIVKDSFAGKVTEENPHMFINNRIETESVDVGVHKISFILDEKISESELKFPLCVDILWDMHVSKQPDSPIYSNKIYENNYLQDYAVIGNSECFGLGQNYLRLRINEYIDDSPENIKEATYNIYNMTPFDNTTEISTNKVEQFWSSREMSWQNRVEFGYNIDSVVVENSGYVSFDITELTKMALEDKSCNIESYGMVIAGENDNRYRIFASSDNPLFPPFEMINFYEMPDNIYVYLK